MFIAPFPIIFLQIKVSQWNLFPWQRCRYFALLPSTLNLSGYETSSCVFFPPLSHNTAVQPLTSTSCSSFFERLIWKVWLMLDFSSPSLFFSFLLSSTTTTQCEFERISCVALTLSDVCLKREYMSWRNTVFSRFYGVQTGARKKQPTFIDWWSTNGVNNV